MKKNILTATALAAVLSVAVASAAHAADAAAKSEKCYGIAKAGQNDCKTDAHACKGQSKEASKADFLLVPAGLCDKITGGSTEAPKK